LFFTNAGALFFRKNDEDVEFRHAGLVCALYKGIDKVYILDAKELGGDIMSKVDDAMVFLKKHLRMSYRITSVRRENILELPEDALREAVVNAVCHRDYFEKGARAMVEIFDDRVDIVSPGGVCKGITPQNFGAISLTRNSVVANLLHRSGYIEQMGTGIKRMRIAAQEAQVAEPEFDFDSFFKVTFKRNEILSPVTSDRKTKTSDRKSAAASDRKAKTSDKETIASDRKQKTSDRKSAVTSDRRTKTSDSKAAILSHIKEHQRVSALEISALLALSQSRVRAILLEMINEGTIVKISDKRYAYYEIKT
jgi:predicted HTH transcriptional regulator